MHGLGSWDVLTFIKAVAKDLVLDSQRLTFVRSFPSPPTAPERYKQKGVIIYLGWQGLNVPQQ